jgi:hypothetical protein
MGSGDVSGVDVCNIGSRSLSRENPKRLRGVLFVIRGAMPGCVCRVHGRMKSAILPAWCYRNPEDIADGLIARTRRLELVETRKPKPARKDRYYTQSRAIAISSSVQFVKKNGGTR